MAQITTTANPPVTTGSPSGMTSTTRTQGMSDQALAALQTLIAQLSGGGTAEQRAQALKKQQTQTAIEALMQLISPQAATASGNRLAALSMQQAYDKNLPAMQRSIEGAGTSGSSMQGVLANQFARDQALVAGNIASTQEAEFARQRSELAKTLASLAEPTDFIAKDLLTALDISKGGVTTKTEGMAPNVTRSIGATYGGGMNPQNYRGY